MGRHLEPATPIGRDGDIREFYAEETFECEPARLFVILGDIEQWPPAGNPRMLSRKEPISVQVSFADATRALVKFERGEQPGTAKLVVHHDLCKEGHQTRSWKAYWKGHFKALGQRVQL